MSAPVSIRSVEVGDIETAVELLAAQLAEHAIETDRNVLRDVTREVVSDPRHGFMLLAARDQRVVGIAFVAKHLSAEHGGIVGWLEELYVLPEKRGEGVGSALLAEITARAQSLGWHGLELEIVEGHERAAPLYRRHGFLPLNRKRFACLFRP